MAGLFDSIYKKSPVWLQQIGISAYGLMWKQRRYGGNFKQLLAEFQKREEYNIEEWNGYQLQRIRSLLLHAHRTVPYYQEVFRRNGIDRRQLELFSLKDLVQLPLLDKDSIRSQPERFISVDADRKQLHAYLTSGTTGTPLAILSSTETDRAVQAAYEARVRQWAGLHYKMSRAMIGGRLVVPQADATAPFWRYNIFEKQLYMSAFHIAPANIPDYAAALNRFKPDYLVGYASAQFFLARMIAEAGIKVRPLKGVLTSSEKLTQEMRNTISTVFQCDVYDGYSGVENCCLASECEYHNLHISPDVGIVELVNNEGQQVRAGELGEIVATGLLNFDQPLIRYRTGDLAVLSDETCACGRQMPVLKELVGRLEDTVIGQDGRETVRFHGIFVGLPSIREAQIVQESVSNFRIKLVVDKCFETGEINIIRDRFEERLGRVNLAFEFVNQIERTERGKFRAVISHVHRQPH